MPVKEFLAVRHLKKVDPVFVHLIKQHGSDLAANTEKKRAPYFHILVRSIINQQLSIKAARTIEKRVLSAQGGGFFSAEKLSGLHSSTLRECGISRPKIRYITGLSQAVLSGELSFRHLKSQDDESARDYLTQYPGIGVWSADMFLMQAMARLDILPIGDLVLRKSMQQHYGLAKDASLPCYLEVANVWRPYRSIACRYLWASM